MKKTITLITTLAALSAADIGTLTLKNRLRWDDPNTNQSTAYRLRFATPTNGTNWTFERSVLVNTNEIRGWQLTNLLTLGPKSVTASAIAGEVESDESTIVLLTFDPSRLFPPVNFRIETTISVTVTNAP